MFTKKPNVKGMHLDSLPVVLWSFTLEIWVYFIRLCDYLVVTMLHNLTFKSVSHILNTLHEQLSKPVEIHNLAESIPEDVERNRRRCSQRFTRLLDTPPPTIHHDGPWCRWLAPGCSKAHPQGLGHSSHPLDCRLLPPWVGGLRKEPMIKVGINLFSQTTHKTKV